MTSALPYQPLGAGEVLPRYAFLEPLLAGRRVLEIGAAASTVGRSAAWLRSHGARSVLALDSAPAAVDAARREQASVPDLRFLAGRLEDVQGGPFDLVLVADAAPLLRAPAALDLLVRLMSPEGHVALGLRNPAGASLAALGGEEPREAAPTWGELLAALQARFACVEVASQVAVAGYRLTPAGTLELETAVDATLMGDEEPGYWLAVAGKGPSGALGAETIVLLPVAPLMVVAGRSGELVARLRLAEEELEEARAQARRSVGAPGPGHSERERELGEELEATRARARRLERDVETLSALERSARQRAEHAEQELASLAAASKGPGGNAP
ncbi:MAG: class I SAM-dependent methyltransferase [Deltaproteobacteria bacterium]|nr:class I SAM-dependent methyltransferase [Deltaproteobacteria bacterium]